MSNLQPKLDSIRKDFEAKAPTEAKEIMHRATADLEASGAADKALGEGDRMPPFMLPRAGGGIVESAEILNQGPLVLTFFRGHW